MEKITQNELNTEHRLKRLCIRLIACMYATVHSLPIAITLILYVSACYCLYAFPILFIKWTSTPTGLDYALYYAILLALQLITLTGIVTAFGFSVSDWRFHRAFLRIGMINHASETPILYYYKQLHKKNRTFDFYFFSNGIPLAYWEDNITELENALNITISNIKTGKRNNIIILEATHGKFDWTKNYIWNNNMLLPHSELVIGKSSTGMLSNNLSVTPHILIGGSTGSGKTWLLKHLLYQCIQKHYRVEIADFKGGIDYPAIWKKRCLFINDIDTLIITLNELCTVMQNRIKLLSTTECNNIDTYNKQHETKLKRIIFACDEVAELLDTKGLDKAEKEKRQKICSYLSSLARLGRAAGIHLILATQRPDADVINGQIKNNLSYHICGKADDVLSRIILDNANANDLVPKDIPGVFLNHNNELFKGFIFDESNL